VLTVWSGQSLPYFPLLLSCHLYHCLSLLMLSLISKLMVTSWDDRMVSTRNGRAGVEDSQGNRNTPPPPSLAQAIASILESHDEQTELLQ
jgi:hypothetical protein